MNGAQAVNETGSNLEFGWPLLPKPAPRLGEPGIGDALAPGLYSTKSMKQRSVWG